ncbi:MAG: hypothetical protein L0Y36_02115 [Planctomycetales bacterium]|nr:hypothetical protein [Planctomycetales bacterium]
MSEKENLRNTESIARELRVRNIPATANWLETEAREKRIPAVFVDESPMFNLPTVLNVLKRRAEKIEYQPTANLVLERQELATESALSG